MRINERLTEWAEKRGVDPVALIARRTAKGTAREIRQVNARRQNRGGNGRFTVETHAFGCMCVRCLG